MNSRIAQKQPRKTSTPKAWLHAAHEVASGVVHSAAAITASSFGLVTMMGGIEILAADDRGPLAPMTMELLSSPAAENAAIGLGVLVGLGAAAQLLREKIGTSEKTKNKIARRVGWGISALATVGTFAALQHHHTVAWENTAKAASRPVPTQPATQAPVL